MRRITEFGNRGIVWDLSTQLARDFTDDIFGTLKFLPSKKDIYCEDMKFK